MDINKITKEAEEYKGYSKKRLKKVIATYKFFKLLNDDTLNFIFTYVVIVVPSIFLFGLNFFTFLILSFFHYSFCWLYLVKTKKLKLVNDEENEEIVKVIDILKSYLD